MEDPIARKLELVARGHDVGGFQMAVHEAAAMQVCQGVQGRPQHLPHFRHRERPFQQHASQVFVGQFHHAVVQRQGIRPAGSHLKNADQVRMREPGSLLQAGKAPIRIAGIGREQLDGGRLRFSVAVSRQEYRSVAALTQKLFQAKAIADDLALPLFPGHGHLPQPPVTKDQKLLYWSASHFALFHLI